LSCIFIDQNKVCGEGRKERECILEFGLGISGTSFEAHHALNGVQGGWMKLSSCFVFYGEVEGTDGTFDEGGEEKTK